VTYGAGSTKQVRTGATMGALARKSISCWQPPHQRVDSLLTEAELERRGGLPVECSAQLYGRAENLGSLRRGKGFLLMSISPD
jgi:hypothetical protein